MSYHIIVDQLAVLKFIDTLLELEVGETYLLRLITRAKYIDHVKMDYDLDVCTCDKNSIIPAIRNFERKYYDSIQDNEVGIYLTLNPRSYNICINKAMRTFSRIVGEYTDQNPISMMYTELRYCSSRLKYFDFDYDHVDPEAIAVLAEPMLNKESYQFLYTKSGLHIIVDLNKLDTLTYPNWKSDLRTLPQYDSVSIIGDNMIPIPGCSQFGFVPYLAKPTS